MESVVQLKKKRGWQNYLSKISGLSMLKHKTNELQISFLMVVHHSWQPIKTVSIKRI